MQGVVVVGRGLEDRIVRPEGDGGAGSLGGAHLLHLLRRLATAELHAVDAAVTLHLGDELGREGVYHAHAYAMQAA